MATGKIFFENWLVVHGGWFIVHPNPTNFSNSEYRDSGFLVFRPLNPRILYSLNPYLFRIEKGEQLSEV